MGPVAGEPLRRIPHAAINNVPRGRGLAASDRNVLTMTRPLSRFTARTDEARSCGMRVLPSADGPAFAGDNDDRTCGGDRRRRPDRADAGGRAGVGGDRRRHRRTTRQSGSRRIASRRSSLPDHRGARSAWRRRSVPRGGANASVRGLRRDPSWTSATSPPATTTCSRSGSATSSASWPTGSSMSSGFRSFAAARWWASRRTTPASTSSCPATRRCERSTSSDATADAA